MDRTVQGSSAAEPAPGPAPGNVHGDISAWSPLQIALLRFGAPAISLAVLAAAVLALREIDFHAVVAMVPNAPLFWLAFAGAYAVPIVADWTIYHRIWGLPASGLAPLTRKLLGNELVLGYVGDAYLYAWARRKGLVAPGAFRAVKDVAILSAVASNAVTLVVAALASPFLGILGFQLPLWAVVAMATFIAMPPAIAMALHARLFSLPHPELKRILATHAVRAVATVFFIALLWHLALPQVALVWWVVFAALRMVLSRLPFISNKDLVLAGIAVLLLGRHADLAALLAMIAGLTLAAHVLVGLSLGLFDLIGGVAFFRGGHRFHGVNGLI